MNENVNVPSDICRKEKRSMEVKLSKQAIREKLKQLDKNRAIRLATKLSKKSSIEDCNSPHSIKTISKHKLSYSSSDDNIKSDGTTVLLSDDMDALSELNAHSSLCSQEMLKKPANDQLSDEPSSGGDKSPVLTPGEDSDREESPIDIALYNLSNDHCYSGSDKVNFKKVKCTESSLSESCNKITEQRELHSELNSEASGCAEVEISSTNRRNANDILQNGYNEEFSDNTPSDLLEATSNAISEIEIPTTPESQIFESDENSNLYRIANTFLEARYRDIFEFSDLVALKIKQFKSSKSKIRTANDITRIVHRLFRFNKNCENNFRNFNNYLIKNFKTLVDEHNIPIEENTNNLLNSHEMKHEERNSGDEHENAHNSAMQLKSNAQSNDSSISDHSTNSDHTLNRKFGVKNFDTFKSILKDVSISLVRYNDKSLFKDAVVKLERCDNKINQILNKSSSNYENSDLDVEIDNLTNLATLKRKYTHSEESDDSKCDLRLQAKRSKTVTNSDSEELYSSDSTVLSKVSESKANNMSCDLSINEQAKHEILNLLDDSFNDSSSDILSDDVNVVNTPKKDLLVKDDKSEKSDGFFSDIDSRTPIAPRFNINLDSNLSDDSTEEGTIKDLIEKMQTRKERRKKWSKVRYEISDESIVNSSHSSDVEYVSPTKKGRKNIRDILDDDNLDEDTKNANKEERQRLKRLTQRNITLSQESVDSGRRLVLDIDADTKEPLVVVHSKLNRFLKPHQRDGVKFMWDNCYESVAMLRKKNNKGNGCILAHCMGLGKTLQVISFAHTIMRHKVCETKTVLVLCPRSVILNWREEVFKWLEPFPRDEKKVYDLQNINGLGKRATQLTEWFNLGGIMLLSYDLYRGLANQIDSTCKGSNYIKNTLKRTLRDPGPDIVFCDEGHILKNEKTAVRKSLEEMSTKRRVVLTGTPMQNNLKEYFWMVHFVKPNLLGSFKEYANRFVNPILNGQHKDSKPRDIKLMKKRSHVLHKILKGTVQRKEVTVLRKYLPDKFEYVLLLNPSDIQQSLYSYFLNSFAQRLEIGETSKLMAARFFADFQMLKKVWTHPYALYEFWKERQYLETKQNVSDNKSAAKHDPYKDDLETMDTDSYIDAPRTFNSSKKAPIIPSDWWMQLFSKDELDNIKSSSKLTVMFDILQACQNTNEKVLVFSSSLHVLNTVEHFLKVITETTKAKFEGSHPIVMNYRGIWEPTIDYFRLDGKLDNVDRLAYCTKFNDPRNTRAKLFLVSTKAGGLGLNMTGANRVIILDVSWNPATDTQSIFRAYRLQQDKTCYIYRLIAMGFMEQKIYERAVTKQAVACRVVDEQQIDRHYTMADLSELYVHYKAPETTPPPRIPEDTILGNILRSSKHVHTYHDYDSLLMNLEEEELDPEEQRIAWEEFLNEKEGFQLQNVNHLNEAIPVQNMTTTFNPTLASGFYGMAQNHSDPSSREISVSTAYLVNEVRNIAPSHNFEVNAPQTSVSSAHVVNEVRNIAPSHNFEVNAPRTSIAVTHGQIQEELHRTNLILDPVINLTCTSPIHDLTTQPQSVQSQNNNQVLRNLLVTESQRPEIPVLNFGEWLSTVRTPNAKSSASIMDASKAKDNTESRLSNSINQLRRLDTNTTSNLHEAAAATPNSIITSTSVNARSTSDNVDIPSLADSIRSQLNPISKINPSYATQPVSVWYNDIVAKTQLYADETLQLQNKSPSKTTNHNKSVNSIEICNSDVNSASEFNIQVIDITDSPASSVCSTSQIRNTNVTSVTTEIRISKEHNIKDVITDTTSRSKVTSMSSADGAGMLQLRNNDITSVTSDLRGSELATTSKDNSKVTAVKSGDVTAKSQMHATSILHASEKHGSDVTANIANKSAVENTLCKNKHRIKVLERTTALNNVTKSAVAKVLGPNTSTNGRASTSGIRVRNPQAINNDFDASSKTTTKGRQKSVQNEDECFVIEDTKSPNKRIDPVQVGEEDDDLIECSLTSYIEEQDKKKKEIEEKRKKFSEL